MKVLALTASLYFFLLEAIAAESVEPGRLQENVYGRFADTLDYAELVGSRRAQDDVGQLDDDDDDDDKYDDDVTNRFEMCDMECKNDGFCELLQLSTQHEHTMTQRCICPKGYGGILCEKEADVCFTVGRTERYCQNEAPCRIENGLAVCSCKEAYHVSAWAGIDCSYPASEYCTQSGSKSLSAFCTNGGACKTYVGETDE